MPRGKKYTPEEIIRPHSSLDYQTPAEFAARWLPSAAKVASGESPRATSVSAVERAYRSMFQA